MNILRSTNKHELNEGTMQSNGLYNVSEKDGNGLSHWFDEDTKNYLLNLSCGRLFDDECRKLIEESEICTQ